MFWADGKYLVSTSNLSFAGCFFFRFQCRSVGSRPNYCVFRLGTHAMLDIFYRHNFRWNHPPPQICRQMVPPHTSWNEPTGNLMEGRLWNYRKLCRNRQTMEWKGSVFALGLWSSVFDRWYLVFNICARLVQFSIFSFESSVSSSGFSLQSLIVGRRTSVVSLWSSVFDSSVFTLGFHSLVVKSSIFDLFGRVFSPTFSP